MPKKRRNNRIWRYVFIILFFFLAEIIGTGYACAQSDNEPGYDLRIRSGVITSRIKSLIVTRAGNYDRVIINGLANCAAPGEPLLPFKTVRFLVPYGKAVSGVNVGWTSKKTLDGSYIVEPAQQHVPLNYTGQAALTPPNPDIYDSNMPFPGKLYDVVSTQFKRGYKILIINLYPVEYLPASGQLSYYDNMNLSLTLDEDAGSQANPFYRGIKADMEDIRSVVDNSDVVNTYNACVPMKSPLLTYQYVIITSDALKNAAGTYKFQDLITHKISKGLTAAIVTTEWIYANYSGTRPDGSTDNATRIRNFISDYYTNYGTQYMLLAGDADASGVKNGETDAAAVVPHRGLYASVGIYTDNDIPADLYYGCLDGTFDNDADGIYGEATDGAGGGDVDLMAEVSVGRAPVDSATEVSNFVQKTIAYENSTDAYLTKVALAGEKLDDDTYGKDGLEEIRNGAGTHGYTTAGMAGTGYFTFTTLYDKDATWTRDNLIAVLNSGIHIINHNGHANNTIFAKTFANANADALTNTNPFLGYTLGCYSGAFDNRTTAASTYGTDDSVLEHFVTSSHGAFAFVGNSRYGWYVPGSTDGISQRYMREFWDAVVGEGIINLGRALQDAKEDTIGVLSIDPAYRWGHFTANLLGDPQTPVNAAFLSPTDFSASNISLGTNSWVTLRWKNSSRANLQSTMIRYRTDGVYPAGETDGTLLCTRTAAPGSIDTFNHTDIQSGVTYHYVGFGYDGSVYEGGTSELNRANVTIIGPGGDTSSSGRSDCFIATACYGTMDAPQVKTLRRFRDCFLLKDNLGRQFVSLYYIVSPRIAESIRHNQTIKIICRQYLQPIIQCVHLINGGNK
ncbi:MAG: hypothetical protein KJ893_00840 [Candidatus Omnitrophica bacterium]|nr:hypothetical protein [Candidatus Omnitrophota bacterium]MBU4478157.1 hypothetical protein [Candidatus Omnitrophota bacterium]MCG2703078.1 C25 family cysteine peptidase [Candidatus Omnitrophota bacterium]